MDNSELAGVFVYELLSQNKTDFLIETSGSTGESKTIIWQWEWMKKSAENTISMLGWKKDDTILICLPVDKTGGWMMLARALILGCKYQVVKAVSDPMKELSKNHSYTLISLTPHQFLSISENKESFGKLNRFRQVLIGGGPANQRLLNFSEKYIPEIYHTYGMTETYSHIALQKLNHGKEQFFTVLPGISIKLNENNCLVINTPFQVGIETTDLAKLNGKNQFEIIGRSNWIINSGGIKINPEQVEKAIASEIPEKRNFYISSEPDEVLGQKVILVVDGKEIPINLPNIQQLAMTINRYAKPQKVLFRSIKISDNGKLIRE